VIVLHLLVVPELVLVQLHDIEDILSLLQQLALFQILQAVLTCLLVILRSCDVLLEKVHSLLTLAHRDEQISVKSLTFSCMTEDELLHLFEQLHV